MKLLALKQNRTSPWYFVWAVASRLPAN